MAGTSYSISIEGDATKLQQATGDAEKSIDGLDKEIDKTTGGKGNDPLEEIGKKIDLQNLANVADTLADMGGKVVDFGKSTLDAFDTYDEGMDTIVTKTGAGSEAMAGFEDIYRSLSGSMPVEMAKVGEAIGEVNTQLGFQGEELEQASKQAIEFSEINGQDVTSSVVGAKQALSAYGMENSEFANVLDRVTKVAQDTGQSTQSLMDKAVKGAPQIKQLGLNFDQGATMIGKFEKAGVDSSGALTSMSKASIQYAKDGKTLQQGLGESIDKIKNASNETEALTHASEIFGTRGATRMVDAIKRGAFSMEDFASTAEDASGTVHRTFQDTLDPIDELQVAQNNLTMVMADFGNELATVLAPILQKISGILQKVGEVFGSLSPEVKTLIFTIGALTTGFMLLAPFIVSMITLFTTFGGLFAAGGLLAPVGAFFTVTLAPAIPIILGVVAAITAVIAIIKNWGAIQQWLDGILANFGLSTTAIWQGIQNVITTVSNAISTFVQQVWGTLANWWQDNQALIKRTGETVWKAIQNIIQVVMGIIVPFLQTSWNNVKTIVTTVWAVIKTVVDTAINAVLGIIKAVMQIINGDWKGAWETIKGVAKTIWEGIKTVISTIFRAIWEKIKEIAGNIGDTLSNAWGSIKQTASNMWNAIKDAITSPFESAWNTVSGIIDNLKNAFNFTWRLPEIQLPQIPTISLDTSSVEILGKRITYPSGFNINWHAEGGIFRRPTLLGNGTHGVGEAGAEAVIPLNSKTLGGIGSMIAQTMDVSARSGGVETIINNVNIDWRGDIDSNERLNQLADEIDNRFATRNINTGFN